MALFGHTLRCCPWDIQIQPPYFSHSPKQEIGNDIYRDNGNQCEMCSPLVSFWIQRREKWEQQQAVNLYPCAEHMSIIKRLWKGRDLPLTTGLPHMEPIFPLHSEMKNSDSSWKSNNRPTAKINSKQMIEFSGTRDNENVFHLETVLLDPLNCFLITHVLHHWVKTQDVTHITILTHTLS